MKVKTKKLLILSYMLILIKCAPPPMPEPIEQIIPKAPIVNTLKKSNFRKKLDETTSTLEIDNSTLSVSFQKDYKIEEHQLILSAHNLPEGYYFQQWYFTINSEGISDISNKCKIISNDNNPTNECTASNELIGNKYKFFYQFSLYNEQILKISFKYKSSFKTTEILFKQQSIIIPFFSGSNYCKYKYTIPDGFTNLGLQENLLKKKMIKFMNMKAYAQIQT